jgi:hypothetical protein
MRTDMNEALTGALHRRAETGSAIDPALLLESASVQGRRLRRRRRMWAIAGSALGATAAIAVAVTALPGMPGRPVLQPDAAPHSSAAAPQPSASAPGQGFGMPPATGLPGALARPDLVGTDPMVLHFSIDDLIGDATSATWSSAKDLENAQFFAPPSTSFMVSVARRQKDLGDSRAGSAPETVAVNGAPGTLATAKAGKKQQWMVTWQPVAGVWARASVSGTSRDAALRMAEGVRFDRATRCAVPFRLATIPAGMAVRQCSVQLTNGPRPALQEAGLWVGDDRRFAWFSATPVTSPGFEPTMTIGTHRVLHTQQTWLFADEPYLVQLSTAVGGNGPIPDSAARSLIAGFRTAGKPDDPATW